MLTIATRVPESLKRKFSIAARKEGFSVADLMKKLICEELGTSFKKSKRGKPCKKKN